MPIVEVAAREILIIVTLVYLLHYCRTMPSAAYTLAQCLSVCHIPGFCQNE